MPAVPNPAAQAHCGAGRTCSALRTARVSSSRSVGAASGAPSLSSTLAWACSLCHADVVGRHPVPDPREDAPVHRHSQNAFRFVVEGEGVWTVVDGDPVAMRRGDLLLTPGWHSTGITTSPTRRWRGSTASTSPSYTRRAPASSSLDLMRSPTFDSESLPRGTTLGPSRSSADLSTGSNHEFAHRRLSLGAHRRRAVRSVGARDRRPSRCRRPGPRRGPLHQPHHRRRRHAHHPRRDAPPTCGHHLPRVAKSARPSGRSSMEAAPSGWATKSGR